MSKHEEVIPEAAVEAAKEAMREVTPPPGVSKSGWLAEHGDFALIAGAIAAAAPHLLTPERVEIGYLCSRGHFVFHDDPDGGWCGSKRTAGVYVVRDPGVEFYGPYEMADDDGFVYASGCGYSEEDYAEELTHARQSLTEQIETWRKS